MGAPDIEFKALNSSDKTPKKEKIKLVHCKAVVINVKIEITFFCSALRRQRVEIIGHPGTHIKWL